MMMTSLEGECETGNWEKNVKAKLKKHQAKAAALQEDLRREKMAIQHMEGILAKIQDHRKMSKMLEASVMDCMQDQPLVSPKFHDQEDEISESPGGISDSREQEEAGRRQQELARQFQEVPVMSR